MQKTSMNNILKYINEFNKSNKGYFVNFDYFGDGSQLKMFCKQEWEWNAK